MTNPSIAARYISGQTIRQIADELNLPTQLVLQEVYTSDEFVTWVFSKPGNTDEFLNRYLEVFTNDRVRDCRILGISVVRYNHVKTRPNHEWRAKSPPGRDLYQCTGQSTGALPKYPRGAPQWGAAPLDEAGKNEVTV